MRYRFGGFILGGMHGGGGGSLFSEFYGGQELLMVDCFFNYGEGICWWKKEGGGWLSLKDQNFGGNDVHCCRPRKSVFRLQPPDIYNRPSPSCKNPHFLNDGKCKAFLVIMIFFA